MKSMRRRLPLLATVLAVAAALAYSTLSALLACGKGVVSGTDKAHLLKCYASTAPNASTNTMHRILPTRRIPYSRPEPTTEAGRRGGSTRLPLA